MISSFIGQGFASPTPFGFQTTPAHDGLGAPSLNFLQPGTTASLQQGDVLSTEPLKACHGSSSLWYPSTSIGNKQAETFPPSLQLNNSWNCDLHNNIPTRISDDNNLLHPTSIHAGYPTSLADVSMNMLLESDFYAPTNLDDVGMFGNLGNMVSQSASSALYREPSQLSSQDQTAVSSNHTTSLIVDHGTSSVGGGAGPFECRHCNVVFKRDGDRKRHERTLHGATYGAFLCPIIGCPRSQGAGYCRADKVTEHLWKKHGNLGYVKSV
jgi:hypothetical protein